MITIADGLFPMDERSMKCCKEGCSTVQWGVNSTQIGKFIVTLARYLRAIERARPVAREVRFIAGVCNIQFCLSRTFTFVIRKNRSNITRSMRGRSIWQTSKDFEANKK